MTARCFIEWDEPHRTQVISLVLTPPLSDLSLPRVMYLKGVAAQGTTLLADQKTAGASVFPCSVSYGFEVSVSAGLDRWLYVPTV